MEKVEIDAIHLESATDNALLANDPTKRLAFQSNADRRIDTLQAQVNGLRQHNEQHITAINGLLAKVSKLESQMQQITGARSQAGNPTNGSSNQRQVSSPSITPPTTDKERLKRQTEAFKLMDSADVGTARLTYHVHTTSLLKQAEGQKWTKTIPGIIEQLSTAHKLMSSVYGVPASSETAHTSANSQEAPPFPDREPRPYTRGQRQHRSHSQATFATPNYGNVSDTPFRPASRAQDQNYQRWQTEQLRRQQGVEKLQRRASTASDYSAINFGPHAESQPSFTFPKQ